MTELEILAFEPAELRARGVGPFQGDFKRVELTTREGLPSNLFLLCSANGRGKTTLLECFVYLISLLDEAPAEPGWLRDAPARDLQLDLWISVRWDGRTELLLLSLFDVHRDESCIRIWEPQELERLPAARQLTWGRVRARAEGELSGSAHVLVTQLRRMLRAAAVLDPGEESQPFLPLETAPTVLYFTFDRDVPHPQRAASEGIQEPEHWRHRLVHRFGYDRSWGGSLDLLLVWLHWLDKGEGRYKRARELVNHIVFQGTSKFIERVDRPRLRAVVNTGHGTHRLDQLSSGERSLLMLFLRVAVHMTRNTIVVIDELDLHQHPRVERELIWKLKLLVQGRLQREDEDWGPFEPDPSTGGRPDRPLLSVLFTTHAKDSMEEFDMLEGEPRLRTGVDIINEDFG